MSISNQKNFLKGKIGNKFMGGTHPDSLSSHRTSTNSIYSAEFKRSVAFLEALVEFKDDLIMTMRIPTSLCQSTVHVLTCPYPYALEDQADTHRKVSAAPDFETKVFRSPQVEPLKNIILMVFVL